MHYYTSTAELDTSSLSMDDIAIRGSGSGDIKSEKDGKTETVSTFVTDIGHIEIGIWDEVAAAVIASAPADQSGHKPAEILKTLERYLSTEGTAYEKNHPEERRHMALKLCTSRKYADPDWQGYTAFQRLIS